MIEAHPNKINSGEADETAQLKPTREWTPTQRPVADGLSGREPADRPSSIQRPTLAFECRERMLQHAIRACSSTSHPRRTKGSGLVCFYY